MSRSTSPAAAGPAARLLARLEAADRFRTGLLDDLASLDAGKLHARPIPGKWSILEIVEHLVRVERPFAAALASPPADLPAPRLRDRLMFGVVMFVLRFDIPVKVPDPRMGPEGGRDLADLRAEWDAGRARMKESLAAMEPDALRRPIVVHPVAGPLDPRRVLSMMDVHLRRHARQIRDRRKRLARGDAG